MQNKSWKNKQLEIEKKIKNEMNGELTNWKILDKDTK